MELTTIGISHFKSPIMLGAGLILLLFCSLSSLKAFSMALMLVFGCFIFGPVACIILQNTYEVVALRFQIFLLFNVPSRRGNMCSCVIVWRLISFKLRLTSSRLYSFCWAQYHLYCWLSTRGSPHSVYHLSAPPLTSVDLSPQRLTRNHAGTSCCPMRIRSWRRTQRGRLTTRRKTAFSSSSPLSLSYRAITFRCR